VHPVQVVQGALELQVPLVQPGQSDSGHPLPFHHDVHAPVVQGPDEPNGPHAELPKGAPLEPLQPPGPAPKGTPNPGPPNGPKAPVGAGP